MATVSLKNCPTAFLPETPPLLTDLNKNSSGDEIANVNFCTTTTYMERPAPTPIEPLLSTINIYGT